MMIVSIAESNAEIGKGVSFSFTTTAEEIDAVHKDYSFVGPIVIQGSIVNTGQAYRLTGVIECEKSFICDRCLDHFTEKQKHEFAEDFRQGEEDDESEAVNMFDGDAIDITDMIRDTILAAQPLNNICRPDCQGLCPKCGANLNHGECGCDRFVPDPRLAALQQLLKKK